MLTLISVIQDTINTFSFHLVRNPRLLARLKEDLLKAEIPTSGVLTRKHIQQLPFLRCCLNESA
jgi:hypothetical protein